MAESEVNETTGSLKGKTAIITGSNTGIGKETAKELAKLGVRVILACRSQERGEAARDDIVKEANNDNVIFKQLDLSSLRSIKAFADDINANEERIDWLVNNAGVVSKERQETEDGFELIFGVNHLGHFYLTNLLMDKLKSSAPSRIVILTSSTHKMADWNHKDPHFQRGTYNGFKSYFRSKTANILHAVQLAKILEGSGVTTYAVHPGAILDTDIVRHYGRTALSVRVLWFFAGLAGDKNISIEEGAKTTLYTCLEPSIASHSGRYYQKCQESRAKGHATKASSAQRLWDMSQQMIDEKLRDLTPLPEEQQQQEVKDTDTKDTEPEENKTEQSGSEEETSAETTGRTVPTTEGGTQE